MAADLNATPMEFDCDDKMQAKWNWRLEEEFSLEQ